MRTSPALRLAVDQPYGAFPGAIRDASRQTTLALMIALIVVAVPLRLIFDRILLDGFEQIETKAALKNVARVEDALAGRIAWLSVKSRDWAWWDDCYAFAKDRNQKFVDSNLVSNSIASMGIEAILLFDAADRRIAASCIDPESGEEAPLYAALERRFAAGSPLLDVSLEQREKFGLFIEGGEVWSFASTAILRTDQTGPANGAIVFAERIDAAAVAELAELTHLQVTLHRLAPPASAPSASPEPAPPPSPARCCG
ncbi:MAG: hypothetical protein FJ293_01515 [Planctomycetes bacterium]|nr:hypothetical protein [Planctomycetota bacterium]